MEATSYEKQLRAELERRLAALPQLSRVVVRLEGEFPDSALVVTFYDSRLPDRMLGHYCSIWNDDGSPIYSSDPDDRAGFISEIVQHEIERSLQAPSSPTEDAIRGSVYARPHRRHEDYSGRRASAGGSSGNASDRAGRAGRKRA